MVTQQKLQELFHYDPETGHFTARVFRGTSAKKAGERVGVRSDGKYPSIWIDGKLHKCHRLAWLYVYGELPALQIDHINGDPADNRISNLRLASQSQNKANTRTYANNRLGVKGVRLRDGAFQARCSKDGRTYHLGSFATVEEASAVVRDAAERLHGQFARTA
jgi:hypothetical protein